MLAEMGSAIGMILKLILNGRLADLIYVDSRAQYTRAPTQGARHSRQNIVLNDVDRFSQSELLERAITASGKVLDALQCQRPASECQLGNEP